MEIEVKKLIDQTVIEIAAIKAAQEAVTKAVEGKASPDEIKALEKELKAKDEAFEAKMNELSKQVDQIQLDQKNNGGKFDQKDSDFFKMEQKMKDKSFVQTLQQKGASHTFEIKTGTTMDTATYLSGSALATAVVVPFREPGVGKAPDRIPTLLDLITRGTIGSDTDSWVERSARTMAAAAVAEGSAYANTLLTYIQRTQGVERLGHFVKVQNRSLDDWDALMFEIQNELLTGLERIIEEEVYKGTGTTPHLQGITDTGFAAAYTSTGLTGVISPNHFDAVRAAGMQIRQNEYQMGAVFVNPATGASFDTAKSQDGIYTIPPFTTANGTNIKGANVYESNLVTAGELLAGDFSKIGLLMRKGIEIRVWEQNEDDVLYDRKTITAAVRCVSRIKTPDYNAFVYDAFDDIVAAIA